MALRILKNKIPVYLIFYLLKRVLKGLGLKGAGFRAKGLKYCLGPWTLRV